MKCFLHLAYEYTEVIWFIYVDLFYPYWRSHTHTDITYTYSGASIRTSWILHICMVSGESELVGCTGCCPGDLRIGNGLWVRASILVSRCCRVSILWFFGVPMALIGRRQRCYAFLKLLNGDRDDFGCLGISL